MLTHLPVVPRILSAGKQQYPKLNVIMIQIYGKNRKPMLFPGEKV